MGLLKGVKEDTPELFGKYVILVGCGKSKRALRSEAQDLYTGSLTRMSIAWAKRNTDRWFILSAKWGLLHPAEKIDPYNLKMGDLAKDERVVWGENFWEQFTQEVGVVRQPFVVLAGADYIEAIGFTKGHTVYTPLDGMKMGERMAWLKRNPVLTKKILAGCRYGTAN